MPIFSYHPCDPLHDPLSCLIYSDIVNRVDPLMPPQRSYDTQFVINPAANGGDVF